MTIARRKLVAEIISDFTGADDDAARRCAVEIMKALENPRKYRRQVAADVSDLLRLCRSQMDGDDIIGHR